MPYRDAPGAKNGRAWFPSGDFQEQKHELAQMIDELSREKDQQLEELGYCTTTRSWEKIDDWLDTELTMAYQSGHMAGETHGLFMRGSWWSRNWVPVLFYVILGAGMLVIGLVNGWS